MLSISKEILADLPAVEYTGTPRLIETEEEAKDAVEYLLTQKEVGFDTETRPNFHKGSHYKVSLLQIATPDECFLFRLNKIGITADIKKLLETEDILKVGLSVKDDFHSLRKLDPNICPGNFLELQSWVKDFDILDNSLSRIHAIIFGKKISKSQRLTNWEADILTEFQQNYAAIDAWACLTIYHHLNQGLFNPKTSPYRVLQETIKTSTTDK